MKLNKIALAVLATAATAASAGVTVTPIVGYNYTDEAHDKQREVFKTGKDLYLNADNQSIDGRAGQVTNGGVAQESGLYTGVALGLELTPSTQFQVEYGVTDTNGEASEASARAGINRFDAERETIVGNFLIGTEQFTGYNPNTKFKPYVLIGAGQSKTSVENRQEYTTSAGKSTQTGGFLLL